MDPSYARVMAFFQSIHGELAIPVFQCTDEDMDRFYPYDESINFLIELDGYGIETLYCLDLSLYDELIVNT